MAENVLIRRIDYLGLVIVGLALGILASPHLLQVLAFSVALALFILLMQLITFAWDRKPSFLSRWAGRVLKVVIFSAAVGIGDLLAH